MITMPRDDFWYIIADYILLRSFPPIPLLERDVTMWRLSQQLLCWDYLEQLERVA